MTESKQTLIVLSPGFPENESDNTCLPFLQSHILAIKENFPSLEVIILTFQYPFFKGIYQWHDNEVISFGGREHGKIKRILLWKDVWKELRNLRRRKNILGIFSLWCTECALIGHYFGKRYKIKHLTWICGQDAKKANKYVKFIRPDGNELIAMSDFLKREFYKNHGIRPAHIMPLGIDPSQFTGSNFKRDIDVLGVGSLIPLKQYDIFVNTVHKLKAGFPGIKTIICGKGPEKGRLLSLIEALHLQNNITLRDEIPHQEALRLMQQAKIFLHTSNYEGLGTVCIEALYAGAHVVSFTKPMDTEIFHWHHVNNEDGMVKKVEILLGDTTITHESVMPYSTADIAKQMMALFS